MWVVLWFCFDELSSSQIVVVSMDIQNNEQTVYRWKWKTTEPTWELRLGMCWLKPFFFSLPTYKASWLISFLKNHRMLESATILIFFFLLQQCHECSVMALSPRKSQICAFCIVLMQFVFPFLVFFVLLFAGTFNTEPLLVLWRRCKDPNTRPEQTREEQNSGEWKYAEDEAIYLCLPGV